MLPRTPAALRRLLQSHPLPPSPTSSSSTACATSSSGSSSSSSSSSSTGNGSNCFSYSYGTAGFRYPHRLLPPVLVRVGIAAALRSLCSGGEAVGVMVTASHNPADDNGVKLADVDGGMLAAEWEGWAVALVNASAAEEVWDVMRRMVDHGCAASRMQHVLVRQHASASASASANAKGKTPPMVVHVGHDTRPHSPALARLAAAAARAVGAAVVDHGAVTTPQLHHCVLHANAHRLPNVVPARPGEGGYMELVGRSYAALIGTRAALEQGGGGGGGGGIVGNNGSDCGNGSGNGGAGAKERILAVDGACGVGYAKIQRLAEMLNQLGGAAHGMVALRPVNGPSDGPLNDGCGAEHVQKNRLPPLVYEGNKGGGRGRGQGQGRRGRRVPMPYAASLDGDADRVVFHYHHPGGGGSASTSDADVQSSFRLLDGDKIAVLVTQFLQEELLALRSAGGLGAADADADELRCGVVQTAYANGAATAYVRDAVGAPIVVAKTGVKFVHAAAHHHFDVGVYFEANGHGTVLFAPSFYRLLDAAEGRLRGRSRFGRRANVALQRLRLLPSLINQSVGDGISDLLLVDAILYLKGWSVQDWDGLYDDLPSRQCKVLVRDRSVIRTNDSETRATAPSNLQPALDAAMAASDAAAAAVGNSSGRQRRAVLVPSRCFVRPSGTENAVRVYAEAPTQDAADALASEAALLLHKLCGGVGDPPPPTVRSRL
jgi:phosphoacetylglucosamine mutase